MYKFVSMRYLIHFYGQSVISVFRNYLDTYHPWIYTVMEENDQEDQSDMNCDISTLVSIALCDPCLQDFNGDAFVESASVPSTGASSLTTEKQGDVADTPLQPSYPLASQRFE